MLEKPPAIKNVAVTLGGFMEYKTLCLVLHIR